MKMLYMDQHLSKRMTFAILFALIFIVVGAGLPDFYYRYLDKTEYYTVSQPVPVNQKWFKPCDDTILTATRTSLVDTQAVFGVDLVLKDIGGNRILKVPNAHFKTEASVKKGEKVTISVVYRLPCELVDGLYYWQATMRYEVHGHEKFYTYVSDTFNVNQYGLNPEIIKIATESAELKDLPPARYQDFFNSRPSPTPMVLREEPQEAGQSGEQTIIINNQQPQPTQMQDSAQPTPNPTPTPSMICILNICL